MLNGLFLLEALAGGKYFKGSLTRKVSNGFRISVFLVVITLLLGTIARIRVIWYWREIMRIVSNLRGLIFIYFRNDKESAQKRIPYFKCIYLGRDLRGSIYPPVI
jgi:hypothetical protein